MPVDDQIASAQQSMHAAAQHPEKQVRTRQSDEGATILPGMQHFVTLLRKAKQPELVLLLIERFTKTALPELAALTDAAKCILPVLSRKAVFHAVAKFDAGVQHRIERAAERVVLMMTNMARKRSSHCSTRKTLTTQPSWPCRAIATVVRSIFGCVRSFRRQAFRENSGLTMPSGSR